MSFMANEEAGHSKPASKVNPVCALFPLTTGATFAELEQDMRDHGQQQACVYDGDELLDGRARLTQYPH